VRMTLRVAGSAGENLHLREPQKIPAGDERRTDSRLLAVPVASRFACAQSRLGLWMRDGEEVVRMKVKHIDGRRT